ncbi:MAG: FCD domain-containing protein, partial [Alphaproteobacteria bacterium]
FKRDFVSLKGAERITIEEHEKIYKAISSGDAEGASRLMAEHIGRASELYTKLTAKKPADELQES